MIDAFLPYIGGLIAIAAALFGFHQKGKRDQARKEEHKRAKDIIQTRERTDAENYLDDDLSAVRDRLRERGKR